MKTNIMNNESKDKRENTKQGNDSWQTAAGVAAGAALGAGGEAFAQDNLKDDDVKVVPPEAQHQQAAPEPQVVRVEVHHIVDEPGDKIQPKPEPEPKPDPEPTSGHHLEVFSVETVTNEDGSQMDVATVKLDGQGGIIADVDRDGVADVMVVDRNGDGHLSENESVNLHQQGITINMADLAHEVGPQTDPHEIGHEDLNGTPQTDDNLIAQQEGHQMPDYTEHNTADNHDYNNNGDVHNFLA